jgi:hypothetical protein
MIVKMQKILHHPQKIPRMKLWQATLQRKPQTICVPQHPAEIARQGLDHAPIQQTQAAPRATGQASQAR